MIDKNIAAFHGLLPPDYKQASIKSFIMYKQEVPI
jgi:hypothetical protein